MEDDEEGDLSQPDESPLRTGARGYTLIERMEMKYSGAMQHFEDFEDSGSSESKVWWSCWMAGAASSVQICVEHRDEEAKERQRLVRH